MIPLTQPDVIAHQAVTPWTLTTQVEQDLLLCRAMRAIFEDDFLAKQVAMRGGTLLHKVHLAPPTRYSEDIDLVVIGDREEGHIKLALWRVLKDVLGDPRASQWATDFVLAFRNVGKPSRILRMKYAVPSISHPGTRLGIQIEANVSERRPYRDIQKFPFTYPFRGEQPHFEINGFEIHEMLGTKLRALFQRDKGRDLYDLYWALTQAAPTVNPQQVIEAFNYYLQLEGVVVKRATFADALHAKVGRRGFRTDMESLLRPGATYNVEQAFALVQTKLLALLPD